MNGQVLVIELHSSPLRLYEVQNMCLYRKKEKVELEVNGNQRRHFDLNPAKTLA